MEPQLSAGLLCSPSHMVSTKPNSVKLPATTCDSEHQRLFQSHLQEQQLHCCALSSTLSMHCCIDASAACKCQLLTAADASDHAVLCISSPYSRTQVLHAHCHTPISFMALALCAASCVGSSRPCAARKGCTRATASAGPAGTTMSRAAAAASGLQ